MAPGSFTMNQKLNLGGVAAVAALLLAAGAAVASPSNVGPPAGAILDLNGQAQPTVYTQYSVNLVATSALTNLSFALRDDPWYLSLDDISLVDVTTSSGNLLVNGDFESGPVGQNAPSGWTYLNAFGAASAGVVTDDEPQSSTPGGAHGGSNYYVDGAVQAYDGITQAVATTVGDTYQVTFWLDTVGGNGGSGNTFSRLSTNGDTTDQDGNGVDLLVYGGAVPTAPGVPEPAAWALMTVGFLGAGAAIRGRRRGLAAA
jgi:hypothetical protein